MLWAAFCLGFFGFLRAGECTLTNDRAFDPEAHLCTGDIAVNSHTSPTLMRVNINMSKTDPFRHGVQLFIGTTSDILCRVTVMLAYLACRGSPPGFLFKFAGGRPLTCQRLVKRLCSVLSSAGVDCRQFSGHSFRIGAATTAAARGIQDAMIKTLAAGNQPLISAIFRLPQNTFLPCQLYSVAKAPHDHYALLLYGTLSVDPCVL